jgi:hypothetical protein
MTMHTETLPMLTAVTVAQIAQHHQYRFIAMSPPMG